MRLLGLAWLLPAIIAVVASTAPSTDGVTAFIRRRLPHHVDSFELSINATEASAATNDAYTVSSGTNGKIQIQGTSPSAIMQGLHRYLADVAHVDIWWFVGSDLDKAPETLPRLERALEGSSIVQYRYHWNTVTTSYTSAFWSWEDWELQLDWMALRGVNLALAWIGVEKIFTDVFSDVGLTDNEISSFLSGPAFLAWQHFGNIQGSWGGDLPRAWIEDQFRLQKKIVKRMVELGMTPILPAFPGFVPENITRVWPDVSLAESPKWSGFSGRFTADKYITPYDPRFAKLQKAFLTKQNEAYGNVTSFWTLDQFNENKPASEEVDYLKNVSHNTWQTLKDADPSAVWVMQGWLFASDKTFWSDERVEAFLDGVPVNKDMLLLDLFAESTPQWQRTDSFYGKPWIWCQLHGYGGNMGLYGQIENVTKNAVEAVQTSKSIVGFGLSMEGQEGNEIMYDLLLDQAWRKNAIETEEYFYDWVTVRYGADQKEISRGVYAAWDKVRTTVYNNTDSSVTAVTKSILELVPSTSGLVNRTGHHATKIIYDTKTLISAWNDLFHAGDQASWLFENEAYRYDLADWTRQVLANAFEATYNKLLAKYKARNTRGIKCAGSKLQEILRTMDRVLDTNANFRLSTWIQAARKSGGEAADFFEYNARNQVTLWGPDGEIQDYASKQWAGLVGDYYAHRWQMFVDYLVATDPDDYDQTAFKKKLMEWEKQWNNKTMHEQVNVDGGSKANMQIVMRNTANNLSISPFQHRVRLQSFAPIRVGMHVPHHARLVHQNVGRHGQLARVVAVARRLVHAHGRRHPGEGVVLAPDEAQPARDRVAPVGEHLVRERILLHRRQRRAGQLGRDGHDGDAPGAQGGRVPLQKGERNVALRAPLAAVKGDEDAPVGGGEERAEGDVSADGVGEGKVGQGGAGLDHLGEVEAGLEVVDGGEDDVANILGDVGADVVLDAGEGFGLSGHFGVFQRQMANC